MITTRSSVAPAADYLGGDAGDDTLDGGEGNDTLIGSWGDDTFLLNRGTGWDVINTSEWGSHTKNDRIVFGADIAPTDVRLTRSYDDLDHQHRWQLRWRHGAELLLR